MPANDRDVYAYFSTRPDTSPEVVALAYAGFAKAKYDWIAHIEAMGGVAPSAAEVDRWIVELPTSRLEGFLEDAIDHFDLAARAYMAEDLADVAEAARDNAVVREVTASNAALLAQVQKVTSFKSTLWPNLFLGVGASFVFSLVIILAGMIFNRDPSPFAWFHSAPAAPPAGGPGAGR
jgi:hypothetical protein